MHTHNPHQQRYLVSNSSKHPFALFTYMDPERVAMYVQSVTTPGLRIQLPLISCVTINKEQFSAD